MRIILLEGERVWRKKIRDSDETVMTVFIMSGQRDRSVTKP
jgi:hypothetical protein